MCLAVWRCLLTLGLHCINVCYFFVVSLILCVVYLTTRLFSTTRWRFVHSLFVGLFVRSFIHGVVRSKVVHAGAFGRWRGSRYQPTEGQVCQLASSYRVKRVTYCTVISRRLGSSTARHCTYTWFIFAAYSFAN